MTRDLEGQELPDLSNTLHLPNFHGKPENILIVCQPRKDKGFACRLVVSTSHYSLLLAQHPGRILWTREEALSSIVTAEMIDLPVSDTDAAIEKEFDNKNSEFLS